MDLHASLADRRRYERQIDRLHARHLHTTALHEMQQDDVSFASIVLNRSRVARLLARTVRCGKYELGPATIRRIVADGKPRDVFAFRPTDLIVHGVVAGIFDEAMAPRLSSSLYSYRPGVSSWMAVSDLAAYVRRHRRERPDPRDRGLYVVRRDIDAYTDSIPVGEPSPVWASLWDLVEGTGSPADRQLVRSVVRPVVRTKEGALLGRVRGVPTGQPISCSLFNLYLAPLDAQLDAVPGGFYARYSDDLVFAHPDPDVAREAARIVAAGVESLGLRLKDEKTSDLYLTGAGRASAAWSEARGTTSLPFLGTSVTAEGTVGLSRHKMRGLLREVSRRARRTAAAMRDEDPDRVGRTVCSVVNRVLDPRTTPFQERSAVTLRRIVTDRRQLAQIDYWLARTVVEAVTDQRGVRAFRATPYRRVRERWGLLSVLHERNRWGDGAWKR